MPITVTRLHPLFFAEVKGVDLRQPVTPDLFAEIEAAFNEHAGAAVPRPAGHREQQVAFSALFGPVFTATKYHRSGEKPRLRGEMSDISNIDHQGRLLSPDDERRLHARANQFWHTDNTFKHIPARCSLLSAREIPASDGDTEYTDMRAAYDALPDARKREIDDLIVEQHLLFARKDGLHRLLCRRARGAAAGEAGAGPPHPGTAGRRLHRLARLACHRLAGQKGRKLIEELLDFATQPQFVHRHRWREGDLVVWDNRCTMHRATPYDEMTVRRVLHRTTVSDEMNSVERERGQAHSAA